MRRLCLFLAFFALFFASRPGLAGAAEVQIHLLVMGPGDHLYTRGGHAAILVAEVQDGAVVDSTVYNYGDSDWDDPLLVPHLVQGKLVFFLSDTGDLLHTLEEYGVRQGREVTGQRLNLTPDQAAEVARRLREGTAPGKREYIFHQTHAVCSTKIMDLLDDVLGGRLHADLDGAPGPYTGRHYHERIFGDSIAAAIGGDLLVGRLDDQPMSKYDSTSAPENMRDYLQAIQVPAAAGSDRSVPLAEPPVVMVARKTPLVLHPSWVTPCLWGGLIALLLGAGASAYRRVAAEPAQARKLVFRASLVSGVFGLVLLALIVVSRAPIFRQNELILLFWPTDLWLAFQMWRSLRKKASPGTWVQSYAHVRLGVAALVVLGHLAGVLIQEPRILVVLGCVQAVVSWVLIRALRTHAAPARQPARLAIEKAAAPSP